MLLTKKDLAADLLQYLIMPDSMTAVAKKDLRKRFANARVQIQPDGSKKYFNSDGHLVEAATDHADGETANVSLPILII